MENVFGPHLVIDLKNCSKEKLTDYNLHFEFLSKIPKLLGMTPITQPYVFPYSGLVPEDKGITGIVIIAESHVSIHSFEEKGYCFIDIFSCKPFDYEGVIPLVCEFFDCKDFEVTTIQRGHDFPR